MPEVKLIHIEEKAQPGFNVAVTLNRPTTDGHVGLEIEVEGNKFPKPPGYGPTPIPLPNSDYWSACKDGSLRGEDSCEYILTKPIMFDQTKAALDELFTNLTKYGSVLDESNRTSVHVHLNCQTFYLNRLTSFMCAWFALEEILVEWCGEYRVGNLFCLRAVDAPALITYLKRFIRTNGEYELHNILHYAALNPNALHKFGSLEIRTLRGCTNSQTILDWVEILERLWRLSAEYPDPRDVVSMFSSGGPLSFFDLVLGNKAETVRQGIALSSDQIAQSVFRGIRIAQDLAYCRDWDTFKTMDLQPDPFGRDARKIAKKLTAVGSNGPAVPMGSEAPSFNTMPTWAQHASSLAAAAEMLMASPEEPADDEDQFYEPDSDISW